MKENRVNKKAVEKTAWTFLFNTVAGRFTTCFGSLFHKFVVCREKKGPELF
jgi:hypothetical protein